MLNLDFIFDPDRPPLDHAYTPDDLPTDWHFLWDERAAIREYDGGLTREYAEAEALKDILDLMQRAGVPLPRKCLPQSLH